MHIAPVLTIGVLLGGHMRRVVCCLAGLALAAAACGGEVERLAVPDFVGMALDEARDGAEALDLELDEVDGSGSDRAVFSPANWTVETQDPTSGAEIEPGGVVIVSLANDRDRQPESNGPAAQLESEDEPDDESELGDAPAREPETAEEVFAASIGDRAYEWFDSIDADGNIFVEFEAADNLTKNMIRSGIERDMVTAFTAAFHEPGTDAQTVFLAATFELVDQYGNSEQSQVWTTELDASEADRINWSDPHAISWDRVWTEVFRHPELRD
jgi:hypothetical protein